MDGGIAREHQDRAALYVREFAPPLAEQASAVVDEGYAAHHGLVWPISVGAAEPAEGEARTDTVCRITMGARIKNGQVRVSDESRLAGAGFRLVHTPDDPDTGDHSEAHHDIDLGSIEDLVAIDRLVSLFDDPEEEPMSVEGLKTVSVD